MSSLDKNVIYFFREEVEKQALLPKPLITFGKMVMNAGKAAGKASASAAKGYGKTMLGVANIGRKGAAPGLKQYAGATVLGAGGIAAAHQGAKGMSKNMNKLKQGGSIQTSGNLQL